MDELTLDELRENTWDYDSPLVLGFYNSEEVRAHLWVIKGGLVDPLIMSRCNLFEGWIEVREYVDRPARDDIYGGWLPRYDEDGEPLKHLEKFSGTLEVLTSKGGVIVALGLRQFGYCLQIQALYAWYRGMCEYVFPAVTAVTSPSSHREAALVEAIRINGLILELGDGGEYRAEYRAACKLMGALSELCGYMTVAQWGEALTVVVKAYKEKGAISELESLSKTAVLRLLREAYFLPWKMPISGWECNLWKKRAPACLVSLATYILCFAMGSFEELDSPLSLSCFRAWMEGV